MLGFSGKLLCVLPVLLISACDSGQPVTPEPAQEDRVIFLRFGHDLPESSANHAAASRMAELVSTRSKGRLQIAIHPGQALGNDHEMIAMAQAGELDIALPPTAKLSTLVPGMQLVDLPFLFSGKEEAYRVLDGTAGQTLLAQLEDHGLTGVAFWESGFKQLTSNKPIHRVEDMLGLKFRVMRSGVLRDQFSSWGSNSLAIDFGNTRKALSDAVVDGQENPLGSIYNMGFHEVQSHLLLSNHGYLAQVLVFSKKSYERLPPQLRNILMQAALEVTGFQRQENTRREKQFLARIRDSKIVVQELDKRLRDELRKRSRAVLEKHRMAIGSAVIEQALATLNGDRLPDKRDLVLALDADLAGNSPLSGLAIRRGMEIAAAEINAAGGVLGRKLSIVSRDNSMVAARGMDNINYFMKIPNLVAVFGGISSPVILTELELIHKNRILFLVPWAAATPIVDNGFTPNYVFRLSVRDEHAAGFLVREAQAVSKNVALLVSNNGWGRSSHEALMKEASKHGLPVVSEQWFDWGEQKINRKIDAIYAAGAEVIIYVGNPVEAAKVVRDIAGRKQKLPVISHWGITGGYFPRLAGNSLSMVDLKVLQTYSFINNRSPEARKLMQYYKKLYSADSADAIVAPTGTAHAYDLVHLLARAIRKAGKADMSAIRDAMETLPPYHGLLRTMNPPFSRNRHEALDAGSYFLARYRDQVLVPINTAQQ